ncbi:MAG: hypothetical protein HZB16_22465 [Armatimonadetes bacterium]|nr:hypothetical protein [Armatimonadota bacterium]
MITYRPLDGAVAWARGHGWLELRARAVQPIPPLLDWCGQLSRAALERRGFTVQASEVDPALRDGVVSQRSGQHSAEVAARWAEYAAMSDDEAGTVFSMACAL